MRKIGILSLLFLMFFTVEVGAFTTDELYELKKEPDMEIQAYMELYVDCKNGSDTNDGSKEKPFRTINKAKEFVRGINHQMTGDIVVNIREGIYNPGYTSVENDLHDNITGKKDTFTSNVSDLIFTPADSGKNGFHVIYQAYNGEHVVIDGGRKLNGWELYDGDNNIYRTRVGSGVNVRQFYVNDIKQQRARSESGLTAGVLQDKESHSNGKPSYVANEVDMSDWANIEDVEFAYNSVFTFAWVPVERIEAVDGKANIYMQQPAYYYATHKMSTSAGLPTWIENAYELLDQPGEWYMNKKDGYLYYMPEEGLDLQNAETAIPEIDVLIDIKGDSPSSRTENLRFSGIEFKNTAWNRPSSSSGHVDSQNNNIRTIDPGSNGKIDWDHVDQVFAAIQLEYAEGIIIDNCKLHNLGATAIRILNASRNNLIQGNSIGNIAGNGVYIGSPEWREGNAIKNYNPTDREDVLLNNDVLNNYFYDFAQEYRSGTAVSYTYAVDTDIRNNDIVNAPYSAMHFGYGWREITNVITKGTTIKNNLVDTFMTELVDGGGIYCLGETSATPEHPNVISENFIRNQYEPKFGAIYFDENSSNWISEENVFEDTEWWLHVSVICPSNHDIRVTNSYATNGHVYLNYELNQKNVYVEPPKYFPNRNFSENAEMVINNAGLTEEYSYLRDDYYDLGDVYLEQEYNLSSGDSVKVVPNIRTVRGVKIAEVPEGAVQYSIADTSIADVSADGTITAKTSGVTDINVVVTIDGITKSRAAKINVDDEIAEAVINCNSSLLKNGTSTQTSVEVVSKFGKKYPPDAVTYLSEDTDVVSVDDNGLVTAKGDGTTRVIAIVEKDGKTYRAEENFGVRSKANGDMFEDFMFWNVSPSSVLEGDGKVLKLSNEVGKGYASYEGKKFGDQTFRFKMRLDTAESDWPSIMLRNQDAGMRANDPGNSGYLITFKPVSIEVQRFNDGARTVFYGAIQGFESKYGVLPNTTVPIGKEIDLEVGIQNVTDGVKISLNADGNQVFEFVDADANRITEDGYFGLIANVGSVTITK